MIGANNIKKDNNNLLAWGFHFRIIENNKKLRTKLTTYILIGGLKLQLKHEVTSGNTHFLMAQIV